MEGWGGQDAVRREAISKDGKHIMRYKFKLKQRKSNGTFMANTCARSGCLVRACCIFDQGCQTD